MNENNVVGEFIAHDGYVIVERIKQQKSDSLPDSSITLLRPPEENKIDRPYEGWGAYIVVSSSTIALDPGDEVIIPHTAVQYYEHDGTEILFVRSTSVAMYRLHKD